MAVSNPGTRLVNRRLGAYFGIFASLFVAVFALALIFSQLGFEADVISKATLLAPVALYLALGAACATAKPEDFLFAGRRVPAVYTGAAMGLSALGGIGLVSGTGLLYLHGFDAWAILSGMTAGFVVMAVLFAPYVRKFGAPTMPSFFGRRLDSRFVRLATAAVFAVPLILLLIAELRLGIWVAREMTGFNERWVLAGLVGTIAGCTVLGGMRGRTWSATAQVIACLGGVVVAAGVAGIIMTNLPIAQMSYGPVLRGIGNQEAALAISEAQVAPLAFNLAGAGLAAPVGRMAEPFASMGVASFILTMLTMMAGIAAAPWLLVSCGTTPGVHAARKSLSWAVLFAGLIMITASAMAVFFRDTVMTAIVGQSAGALPDWFNALAAKELARVTSNVPSLPISAIAVHRDAVLFALPAALDLPEILTNLLYAAALAAVLAATANTALALGLIVSEDVIGGLRWAPPSGVLRLSIGRLATLLALFLAAAAAQTLATDPLQLFLWAIGISASTAFPLAVMCIWEKRLTASAAGIGLLAGFGTAIAGIVIGTPLLDGMAQPALAALGLPVAFVVMIVLAQISGTPSRAAIEFVRDMRIPGGETIYDREMRLLRLKAKAESN
ncbi:MAG: sodium:solute symporter [Pseudomonadota bacterium]